MTAGTGPGPRTAVSKDYLTTVLAVSLFLVLVIITVFRRRLSSNDLYREQYIDADDDASDVDEIKEKAKANGCDGDGDGNSFSNIISGIGGGVGGGGGGDGGDGGGGGGGGGGLLWRRPSFSRIYDFLESSDSYSFFYPSTSSSSSSSSLVSSRGRDRLTTLPPDLLLVVVSFLLPVDIGPMSSVSRGLAKDLKSDFIWEQLWLQHYGEMWRSEKVQALRKRRGITWSTGPCPTPPPQGWFIFYLEFEACWLDWLLAGMCTTDLCVIGLGGSVYDITAFLPRHPGSAETLCEACGGDGTEAFADIGHSSHAVETASQFIVCLMPEHATCGQYQHRSRLNRHRGSRRGHVTKFQSSMKREQQAAVAEAVLQDKLLVLGLLRQREQQATAEQHGSSNVEALRAAVAAARGEMVCPTVGGYYSCPLDAPHFGRARACYDPLQQRWVVWWTCCGTCSRQPPPGAVAAAAAPIAAP